MSLHNDENVSSPGRYKNYKYTIHLSSEHLPFKANTDISEGRNKMTAEDFNTLFWITQK